MQVVTRRRVGRRSLAASGTLLGVAGSLLLFALACSDAGPGGGSGGSGANTDDGDRGDLGTGGFGSGDGGGGTAAGSGTGSGAGTGAGGASGGAPAVPVDCSGITSAGYELCASSDTTCETVYTDGTGCDAVCAAAGLSCSSGAENVDDACAMDETLPTLPCDSGHQSDYCICVAGEGGGTGGTAGTGGTDGAGGTGGGAQVEPTNCNEIEDQPILTVAKTGSPDFGTVQAAINSISQSNTTPTIIRIAPGTYSEKLVVNRPHITLCGEQGAEATTILTYGDGADTSNGNGGTLGTSGSASVNLSGNDVSVENLTMRNTRGVGSQAVALRVSGQRVQFRKVRFIGNQDTLYTHSGSQYFKDCYVEGTVDYIFGGATAVFESCTAHTVGGGTAVTAPSTEQAVPFGLVFLGGQLTAAGSVSSSSQNLGRNWGAYGMTVFIQTALGAHITGPGWAAMGSNTLDTARFAEFQTTGAGAKVAERVSQSDQLTADQAAAYTVDNIFGSWNPSFAE